MTSSKGTRYHAAACNAGISDAQLHILEQLFGIDRTYDEFASELRVVCACESIQKGMIDFHAIRELLDEQSKVEADIRSAFADVTREGGTSWSEGWAIDVCESEEKCLEARASDKERSWKELVDDENWFHENGPWPFLDAIGLRYYLAPAMIRNTRCGWLDDIKYQLSHYVEEDEIRALLSPFQNKAIHRFLNFILSIHDSFGWKERREELAGLCEKWRLEVV